MEPTKVVRTVEELRAVLHRLLHDSAYPIGFDTEADCAEIVWRGKKRPNAYSARLVGFSLSLMDENWYVPVAHEFDAPGVAASNIPAANARLAIQALLDAHASRTLVAHNWKFDLQVLKNFGVQIPVFSDKLYDSLVAAWLAGWGADHKALKLKKLQERLGLGTSDTFDEVAKGRKPSQIPVVEIAPYAGRDAWLCVKVLQRAWVRLEQYDLVDHYHNVDMPLVEVLRDAEETGNEVDRQLLSDLRVKLQREAEALREEFRRRTEWIVDMPVKRKLPTGEFFKNGKPKLKTVEVPEPTLQGADVSKDRDVARWMYEELKLWPTKGLELNGNGHYPVDKDTLEKFLALPGDAAELAQLRLEYGKRSKLISTYIDPILGLSEQYADGLLHTTFNLCGTTTQRFSSAGPNLQNLPSRTEEGKLIRRALRAPKGWKILVYDYSQLELRLTAHFSKDEEMTACYALDEDIHQGTLDGMKQQWSGATRTDAKITNFSTIYRISAGSLAVKMRTTEDKAEASIEAFYARFRRVPNYHRLAIAFAAKHGYAQTLGGYKRFLEVEPVFNRRTRQKEMPWGVQNEAINTPIQGSGAEFAKRAMRDAHRTWIAKGEYGVRVKFLGQEHDSLIAMAREDFADEAELDLKHAMENVWPTLRVPLVADGGRGDSWAEAKEAA